MKVLVMTPERKAHPDEELLEGYVMETISEEEALELEEHLLTCEDCRQALTATEAFVAAMKAAGTRIRSDSGRKPRRGRLLRWISS